MSRRADRPRADLGGARSIAWPIFALVITSVVVAAFFIFAVTFNGPPPRYPAREAAIVARILRTGMVPPSDAEPKLRYDRADDEPMPDRRSSATSSR